jgi:hypothetical protein
MTIRIGGSYRMDSVSRILCKACNTPKPRDDFYDNGNQKHLPPEVRRKRTICKECEKVLKAPYKDRANELRRIRRKIKGRTEERRRLRLKHTYKMTTADYEVMWNAQNGACAICGNPETWINQYGPCPLSVDHDHKTGRVRGLLCSRCNLLLGRYNDDVILFRSIATYLEKS